MDSSDSDCNKSDSEMSVTDSSENTSDSDEDELSHQQQQQQQSAGAEVVTATENGKEEVEEEEDEVIKAIRQENERKQDHPPAIACEEFVMDICFHPNENILAVADILGDVTLYEYSNEKNKILKSLELHTRSCRDIEFSNDGKLLFSTSKDKSVMISDVESSKLVKFYEEAHEQPIYCITIINKNLFATGDDEGTIKLWDLRMDKQIYKTRKNDDYISDMIVNETEKYLVCSSGDGSLTTIDLQNRKVHMQTEEYEEELTCMGLFKTETKLVAGSSKGKLYLYNWNEFGLHSDVFPGTKSSINDMVPITENIVVTASEDGNLRAVHLFPHRHLGIVGQHDLSIENVDISNNGEFIASSSHNNDVKFWNIKYFEDFENNIHKPKKHHRKKEIQHNLPSSQMKNVSDFFSDMC